MEHVIIIFVSTFQIWFQLLLNLLYHICVSRRIPFISTGIFGSHLHKMSLQKFGIKFSSGKKACIV